MADNEHVLRKNGYQQIKRISWIGLIVNLLLSAIKFIFGVLGNSQAVIADAIHSLSDLSTDIAVIGGSKFWLKPADESHPYGHKRIEVIITTFIGVVLLFAGISLGFNALASLRCESASQPGIVALWGAVISVVAKEVLYRYTLRVGKRVRSQAVIANAQHHRTDAFSSIPVAVAVGVAAFSPQWYFLDNVAAVIVSLFILYSAAKIIKPVLLEILGTAAPVSLRQEIYNIVTNTQGVKSMHAVRTRRMGGEWYIDLHIQVRPEISVRQGHNISELVKKNLINSNNNIIDVVVHLEPYE